MKFRTAFFGIALLLFRFVLSQNPTSNISSISIDDDNEYGGFELLEIENEKLFVLAEHWHNIRSVPKATLKVLKYLHQNGNVRILAIEQGKSVAMMINSYLASGDTTMLQDITRNTMFWGKENRQFFYDVRNFNQTLPENERITVKSIDIEYKMESAIYMINHFIGKKEIPETLATSVGTFRKMYADTKEHREQYDGLALMYYYDHDLVEKLVRFTLGDLVTNKEEYEIFFESHFHDFSTMIKEMDYGLTFDYTNPNNNYKFRDKIIHQNFIELANEYPNAGILCAIGSRHVSNGSSISLLKSEENSPIKEKVMIIRITSLYGKNINSGDLKKINFNYPNQLKSNSASLIRHDKSDPVLKNKKGFDYTLFINSNGSLTPYPNRLTENY